MHNCQNEQKWLEILLKYLSAAHLGAEQSEIEQSWVDLHTFYSYR